MEEFSETNPIPRSANRKKAESMGALKISNESDDFVFDKIHIEETDWKMKSLKMKWRRKKMRGSWKMNKHPQQQ